MVDRLCVLDDGSGKGTDRRRPAATGKQTTEPKDWTEYKERAKSDEPEDATVTGGSGEESFALVVGLEVVRMRK